MRLVEDENAPKPYKMAFLPSTNIHKPSTLRAHTNWPKQGKRSPLRVQPSRTSKKKINTAVRIDKASSLRVSHDNMAFTGEQIHQACAAAFAANQQEFRPMPKNFAFKAVNPDTGALAEYPVLIQSSDGKLWEEGMCNELG